MSELNIHTFVVGDKEYQMIELDAFTANKWFFRLNEIITSVMGSGLDTNISGIAKLLNQEVIDKDIFPLFDAVQLTCTSERVKLKDRNSMNQLFSAATLFDFYLVILEVVKFNFGPFISELMKNLFGVELSAALDLMKKKMKNVGEAVEKLN